MRYFIAFLMGTVLASPVVIVDALTTHNHVVRICELTGYKQDDWITSVHTTEGVFLVPTRERNGDIKSYDLIQAGQIREVIWRGGNILPRMLERVSPTSASAPQC